MYLSFGIRKSISAMDFSWNRASIERKSGGWEYASIFVMVSLFLPDFLRALPFAFHECFITFEVQDNRRNFNHCQTLHKAKDPGVIL